MPTARRPRHVLVYRRPGHHFGLHRDIHHCDVAAITCIERSGRGDGGELLVFPRSSGAPLRNLTVGHAHRVRIECGETIVLLGGHVPHMVTPVTGRLVRVVAPLCYRVAAG